MAFISRGSHLSKQYSLRPQGVLDAESLIKMSFSERTEGVQESSAFPWHLGVYDAHCHPTDTVASRDDIAKMHAKVLTIMATRGQDQHLVAEYADALQDSGQRDIQGPRAKVIPSFGWHPWFSYYIYDDRDHKGVRETPNKSTHYKAVITPSPKEDAFIESLPDPMPLSLLLTQTRSYLKKYPGALVGEIGLDRSFRIPLPYQSSEDLATAKTGLTPGGREGRTLSSYRVHIDHQCIVLKAQLNLAGEMNRAVSVHGVAAHGVVFDVLQATWKGYELAGKRAQKREKKDEMVARLDEHDAHKISKPLTPKPFPPRVCLHSFSGPPESLKQYLSPRVPAFIFFSFSRVINFSTPASTKAIEVIKTLPDDRILVESDLHCAGDRMDGLLEEMVRTICETKGWQLEEGVKQLGANWRHFALGEASENEV